MVPYFAKWRPKLSKVFPNNNLYLIAPAKWGKSHPLLLSFQNIYATAFCSGNPPVSRALAYQYCSSHHRGLVSLFFTPSKFAAVAKSCELFWGQIEWAGLAVLSANRWSCKLITGRKSLLWAPGLSPQDVWLNLPEKKKKRLKSTAHRKYTGFIFPEIYAICIQHHTQPKQPPENCWGTIEVLRSTT